MSKTYEELADWVASQDSIRTILVHIEDINGTTQYLSNKPYVTEVGDTPSSVSYIPCLVGSLNFTESLDITGGTASIGYGTLDINNKDGRYDSWTTYVWKNKPIKIFLGDPRWPRADFYLMFEGVVDDITSNSREIISIQLYNKIERLNSAISEKTIAQLYPSIAQEVNPDITPIQPLNILNAEKPVGAVQNREAILPLCFGECFNISPLRISELLISGTSNRDIYMVHDGPIESIIEIRDNGIPLTPGVGYTVNLSQGTFELLRAPYGTITCDVQGAKPSGTYLQTIGKIIPHIVLNYGPPNSIKYTNAEIDTGVFDTYTQSVGIYITDRENVFDICQQLANSVGAQLSQQYNGKLILQRLTLPGFQVAEPIVINITENNTLYEGITIRERAEVRGQVKLAYAKNFTEQQEGLAGAVAQESLDIYKKPHHFIISKDDTTITNYKLTTQPTEEETLLIDEAEALAEAQRRLGLFKVQRTIFEIQGRMEFTTMVPGLRVTLQNYRFGLSTPKEGVVVQTSKDWVTGKTTIGVLV